MSLAINHPGNVMSSLIKFFSFKKTTSVTTTLTDTINIFLTIDQATIGEHFNLNDPAPLYKRQLSHQFNQYLMTSVEPAKRNSVFYYKVTCKKDSDKQYTEAFIYAIKRHFSAKKLHCIEVFEKFKKVFAQACSSNRTPCNKCNPLYRPSSGIHIADTGDTLRRRILNRSASTFVS